MNVAAGTLPAEVVLGGEWPFDGFRSACRCLGNHFGWLVGFDIRLLSFGCGSWLRLRNWLAGSFPGCPVFTVNDFIVPDRLDSKACSIGQSYIPSVGINVSHLHRFPVHIHHVAYLKIAGGNRFGSFCGELALNFPELFAL